MFSYGTHHPRRTVVHSKMSDVHKGSSRVRAVHNVAKGPKVNVIVD